MWGKQGGLGRRVAVIGQSRVATIDRVVYVTPAVYGQITIQDRYSVARLIGKLEKLAELKGKGILTEEEFSSKKAGLLKKLV